MAVCFLLTTSVLGQNPFDIKNRKPVTSSTTIAQDTASAANSDTTATDTVSKPAIDTSQSFVEQNFQALKQKNPFEVTHVPISKKKVTSIGQIEIKIKPKVSNSFIIWIMIFSWALLALVLGNKRDIVPKSFRSIFNENVLKLTKRQENDRYRGHFIMVYIVFFINISVFIFLVSKHFSGQGSTFTWFLILLGVIGTYLTRHISLSTLGWVFPIDKETSLYSFMIMIINLILGLALIPINLMMAFGSQNFFVPTMYTGLGIIIAALIIRYTRGLSIGGNYIFNNIFLFIIYLCAFEIAPTLLGIRLIADRFSLF